MGKLIPTPASYKYNRISKRNESVEILFRKELICGKYEKLQERVLGCHPCFCKDCGKNGVKYDFPVIPGLRAGSARYCDVCNSVRVTPIFYIEAN